MKCHLSALAGAVLLVAGSNATATTLNGMLSADDTFSVYVSVNNGVLGTLVHTGDLNWETVEPVSAALTPGVTNYLHIVASDTRGSIAGFLGQITLSDAQFHFANGTQNLVTNTTNWAVGQGSGPWFAPGATPSSYGPNGSVGFAWPLVVGVSTSAEWIWWGNNRELGTAFFSTEITPNSAVPLPPAALLFVTGLAVLGFCGRRKNRHKPAATGFGITPSNAEKAAAKRLVPVC
jgi:hypothetical protein